MTAIDSTLARYYLNKEPETLMRLLNLAYLDEALLNQDQ